MDVTATATRSGAWWAVTIVTPHGPLHTQVRRLDQIPAMAVDAVALAEDVTPGDVVVQVVPQLSHGDELRVAAAKAAAAEAVAAAERASRASRDVVTRLRGKGMTVRDVGALLEASPQRVSQLARKHRFPVDHRP